MKGRAYRRHQRERAECRAWRFFVEICGDREPTPKMIRAWSVQRKPCSCGMCCNPRRYEGPSRKERAAPRAGVTA